MQGYKSDYEKYILLSDITRTISGTYPGYLKLKELMGSLNQMASKNSNTYTYNGELYVSRLTNSEINGIQKCLDTGDYSSSFEKIKYIFVDIGSRSF
tara:strand:- start:385 stop:675 length:291 start_codon:yes stop_codon:yes gene_type:complete